MTYEEARVKLGCLRDKQKSLVDEAAQRKKYLKETLGFETCMQDCVYAMIHMMIESNSREISALKKYVARFPEAESEEGQQIKKKMWSGLSEPEKVALALLRMEVGADRFAEICKQGYDTVKRRYDIQKRNKELDDADAAIRRIEAKQKDREFHEFDKAMRTNRNSFASEEI